MQLTDQNGDPFAPVEMSRILDSREAMTRLWYAQTYGYSVERCECLSLLPCPNCDDLELVTCIGCAGYGYHYHWLAAGVELKFRCKECEGDRQVPCACVNDDCSECDNIGIKRV